MVIKKNSWRSRSRTRKSRAIILAALLPLIGATIAVFHLWPLPHTLAGSHFERGKTALVAARSSAVDTSQRPTSSAFSPSYAVIPGGVHSEEQLAEVLAHDPVVAKHYADFDLHKLRFVQLRRGREAYVSYRLGNLIFWTSHKIPLFAGETLLTDGTHYARARCGNRISEVPKQPTSSLEPSDQALAAPILHLSPSAYKLPPFNGGARLVPEPLGGGGVSTGSSSGSPIFPVVFLPPGGGGSSGGSGDSPTGIPPGGGPVAAPEPGTIVLLCCGLVALGLKYLWPIWRERD